MNWYWLIVTLAEYTAGLALCGAAIYCAAKRPIRTKVGIWGSVIIIIGALWLLLHALEISTADYSMKVVFHKLQFVCSPLFITTWLFFTLNFIGLQSWIKPGIIVLLAGIISVELALIITNESHTLVWKTMEFDTTSRFWSLHVTYGPVRWIIVGYNYIMGIYGAAMLFSRLVEVRHAYRREIRALAIIVCIAIVVAAVESLDLDVRYHLGFAPLAWIFALSSFIGVWTLRNVYLQDVRPIIHSTIIDGISDFVVALDGEGRVIALNKAAENSLGQKTAAVFGKPAIVVWPDWHDLLLSGSFRMQTHTEYILNKDGDERTYDVSITNINDTAGKPSLRVLLFRDITEHKKADEALRQSEQKMRLMFESITDGIIVTDLEGKITQVNEAVVRTFGYSSKDELVGRENADLIALKDRAEMARCMEKTRETGFGGVHEFMFVKKNGKEFPGQCSTATMIDYTGQPAGYIAIAKDMTDFKRMEDELRMRERLATIGQMVGGVAHELNNPLNVVILLSEMLMEQDVPEKITDDIRIIYDEAQRAAAIVKDLLTFARKRPAHRELLKIQTLLEEVLRLRSYEQKVDNIQVVTRFSESLPDIIGDRFQLQQVFLNIILNAEDAMTTSHKRGILDITTEPVDGMVRISLADDGPGISPENLPHVFDPFFTTKETGKGTGLGLSICYGIVKSHNGAIYIDSEVGKGTTVVVVLPVSE